ncbi:MAG: hypothetical protein JO355_05680 [Planctomycetaceae bacterium]|nr:hypothetical protein [Planctomycetaceae bacterium]
MLDQILHQLRKTTESTIQLQHELSRQWIRHWSPLAGATTPEAPAAPGPTAPGLAPQGQWADALSDLLNRHREDLESVYRAGIDAIEDAFRAAETKDPTQLLTLTEELWWQAFATLRTAAESQVRDLQAAADKVLEATAAPKV